jgi:hypothetical protein
MRALFCLMLTDLQHNITFWRVPRLLPSFIPVKATRRWRQVSSNTDREKLKYSKKNFPNTTLSVTNLTWTDLGSNLDLPGDLPATNHLSLVTDHLRNKLIICKVSVCTSQRTRYAFIRKIIRLQVYRKSSCLAYEWYETQMHCESKVKSFDVEANGTDEYPIIFASCFVSSCAWLVSDRIRLEGWRSLELVSSWRLLVRIEESHEQPRSKLPVLLARFHWGLLGNISTAWPQH